MPTSSSHLSVGRHDLAALEAVLPLCALFFEELRNGTRLRLVSGALPGLRMESSVEEVRARSVG